MSEELGTARALDDLRRLADKEQNGSRWLRETYAAKQSLADVVRLQSELWSGD